MKDPQTADNYISCQLTSSRSRHIQLTIHHHHSMLARNKLVPEWTGNKNRQHGKTLSPVTHIHNNYCAPCCTRLETRAFLRHQYQLHNKQHRQAVGTQKHMRDKPAPSQTGDVWRRKAAEIGAMTTDLPHIMYQYWYGSVDDN